jgi:hypothetical protein
VRVARSRCGARRCCGYVGGCIELFFLELDLTESKLRTQLTQALDHSALPDEELLAYIGRFQADIARAFLHAHTA